MDQGPPGKRKHDGRSYKNRKARRAAQRKVGEEKEQLQQQRGQLEERENRLNKALRIAEQVHDEMVGATLTAKRQVQHERDENAHWMRKTEEARTEARKAEVKYQGLVGELECRRNEAVRERDAKEKWKQKLKAVEEAVCASHVFSNAFINPCACQESNMWQNLYFAPEPPAPETSASSSSKKPRQWLLICKGTVAVTFPLFL